MIARVVTKRDESRLALFVTGIAALGLGLVLADDIWHSELLFRRPPSIVVYCFVAMCIALGGIGPWLAWSRRRGHLETLRFGPDVVEAGKLRIEGDAVSALSVARGARGTSVAIAHGNHEMVFLEVERREDADRIAQTLGVPRPPLREVLAISASRVLAVPQIIIAIAALLCAPAYLAVVLGHEAIFSWFWDAKAFFGVGGLMATELAMLLLVVRRFVPGQAMALRRRGAWDAHVALHHSTRSAAEATIPAETSAEGETEAAVVRIGHLARGNEGVGAWLARLDAIPTEQHAYRGDAMKKDVLWETLGDAGASVDTRMGAARLLRRRYGAEEGALVRVVEDPDVRVRVEAALEEHEDAERAIETLGPLFRAR